MSRANTEILCVETNEVFESLTSAAKSFNVTPIAIRNAIVKKGKCKGNHFLYNATPTANARNINLLLNSNDAVKIELMESIKKYQREIEILKDNIFIELFRCWYNKEVTIDECAEISGYSKAYLYQIFRAMKIERGLD